MAYDQKMRQSLFEMGDELQIREQSTEYLQLGSLIRPFLMKMVQLDNMIKPTNNQKLFSESAELINELIGAAQYIKRVNQAQVNTSNQLLTQAKQLSTDTQREYDLE